MNDATERLEQWMQATEGEHFEFKEAKNRYDFEELCKYCAGMALVRGERRAARWFPGENIHQSEDAGNT